MLPWQHVLSITDQWVRLASGKLCNVVFVSSLFPRLLGWVSRGIKGIVTHSCMLRDAGTEQCCRTCCYSTPFATLFAVGIIVVGMVGYSGSAVYGVVAITMVESLYRQ